MCLSNEPRISVELSYGKIKKFNKIKFKNKKKNSLKTPSFY